MIISSFKPAVSYKELNSILARILFGNAPNNETSVFEHKFAQYLGVKYAIRVPSARWGLYYILKSLNLEKGGEIILPAFTYFAVPAAIIKLGLKPVFADINHEDLNINIQEIKENISGKTRAIIPTHLCGFVAALDEIIDIARKYNIKIIEDCAQSLGAEYKNKKVGSFGEASYFTFGITKHFTTLEGATVVTSNDELADVIRQNTNRISPITNKLLFLKVLKGYIIKLAASGGLFPATYTVMRIFSYFGIDIVDYIFREKILLLGNLPNSGLLNNLQAELGMMQLNDLDIKNAARAEEGFQIYDRLKGIGGIRISFLKPNAKNIFSNCPILVKNKENVKRMLLKKGVDVSSGYMQDCSRLNVFKEFRQDCPNARRAEREILYLPLYAGLTHSELIYITEMVKQAVE